MLGTLKGDLELKGHTMKSLLVCLCLSILSSTSIFSQAEGSMFLNQNDGLIKTTNETETITTRKKSPELAFALSLVFPGAGQYYNGDVRKGLFQDFLIVMGATMFVVGSDVIWNRDPYGGTYYIGEGSPELKTVGTVMVVGTYFWSLIDAPLAAQKKNGVTSQNQFGHLLEFEKGKSLIGIDLGYIGNGFGSKVTYHF